MPFNCEIHARSRTYLIVHENRMQIANWVQNDGALVRIEMEKSFEM